MCGRGHMRTTMVALEMARASRGTRLAAWWRIRTPAANLGSRACWVERRCSLRASAGVFHGGFCRVLRASATASRSSRLCRARSYWRSGRWCSRWCTVGVTARPRCRCGARVLGGWSQVKGSAQLFGHLDAGDGDADGFGAVAGERGAVVDSRCLAVATVNSIEPGAALDEGALADRLRRPMIRSPSQWPGTARSSALGKWVMS